MKRRMGGPFAPYDKSVPELTRRRFLKGSAVAAAGAATAGLVAPKPGWAADSMSFLTWCDHADSRLIGTFQDATGVTVDVKTYEGTGSALAVKEQSSPGDWDLFCLDFQDTPMVSRLGIIDALDDDRVPWDKYFPGLREQPHSYTDGKLWGVPDKFGYYGVAYNKNKVDPEDAKTAEIMYNPKYKNRIAVYDYYFPVIQLVGISRDLRPQDITVANLESTIREPLLELKANAQVVGDILTVLNALYTESVDMIIAGSEWSVALDMAEIDWLDWTIFDEGGLLWNESLCIFSDSEKKDFCWDFIDHTLSPDGQRYLATSECFWGLPVIIDTPMSDQEKTILRWDQQQEFLARSYASTIGGEDLDEAMLDLWTEFLQA
ncbi:MAG: extracellular solute-binding protein [Proteobacteria bacterium]|nr:extracellular solute-binding protein [Pseudomonadota bacterium]